MLLHFVEKVPVEDVFSIFEKTKVVDFIAMVTELSERTHLPLWVCKKVYLAENSILSDLGLLKQH